MLNKLVRTTRHILKFSNKTKLDWVEKLYQDYGEALQICINWIYEEKLPLKTFLTSAELPNKIGNITHSRWRALIFKQASEIVRGTKEADRYQKYQRFKKVYVYFKKKGRQLKFLEKHFSDLNLKKYPKPEIKNVSIVMDYRFTDFEHGNSFDEFMKLHLPYFIEGKRNSIKVNLPIKLTKMDRKFRDWKRRDAVIIEKINEQFYVDYIYEKQIETRNGGLTIGIDFGEKKLLTTSRGEFLGTEIESICNEINHCKFKSNHYYGLLRKRNQYIDEVVKSLDTENVSKIIVEDLKDLKKHTLKRGKFNKKHRKTFRYVLQERTFSRLENLCMEQGIELVKVSPAYTSQTCSRCGTVDKSARNGESYHCKTCGYEIDADFNGALNILHRGVYSPSNSEK